MSGSGTLAISTVPRDTLAIMVDVFDNGLHFLIEDILDQQAIAWQLPFINMDKSCEESCKQFDVTRTCPRGSKCPYRHVVGEKKIVCKHWLRALCKKGDNCEFLHRYDLSKMPECFFWTTKGECNNEECPFLHIDPEKKKKDCDWYARGFCKHGAQCKNRHVKKIACVNYLCGFCPDGSNCKFAHPRWEIPIDQRNDDGSVTQVQKIPPNRFSEKDAQQHARNMDQQNSHDANNGGGKTAAPSSLASMPPQVPTEINPESIAALESQADGSGMIHKLVRVPDNKVGLIIGKGGATFRQFSEESGAKINIPKAADPGKDYREITVSGTAEEVLRCEAMILGKVNFRRETPGHDQSGPTSGGGEMVTFKLMCPDDKVGILIGKQGSTIRQLHEESGAKIHIPKECNPGEQFREITITGSRESVDRAQAMIHQRLSGPPQMGMMQGFRGRPMPQQMPGYPPNEMMMRDQLRHLEARLRMCPPNHPDYRPMMHHRQQILRGLSQMGGPGKVMDC